MKDRVLENYPLSPMQQGMLFHNLAEPHSGVDVEQMVCGLPEALDTAAFRQAWSQLVARHAVLRTAFEWTGLPEPRQNVHASVELPWAEQDWREISPREQQQLLDTFRHVDRCRGFRMDRAPLMRLTLFRVEDAAYRLVWTFHHALLDGRSFPILLQELFAFYEAGRQGTAIALPPPPPYRQYLDWLQQRDTSRSEAFWRGLLQNFRTRTPLVVDRPEPVNLRGQPRQADRELHLSTRATAALQAFAQDQQVTLNTLVHGAWAILLGRYSREPEVVFGVTLSNRRDTIPGAAHVVGLCINTLPMRVPVEPHQPLRPWLADLRQQWLRLRGHEHTPLVRIQSWSDLPPGEALFESLVLFERYQLEWALHQQGDAWSQRSFRLYEQTNYPITLAAYGGSNLQLKLQYDRSRFEDAPIQRMAGHLKTLLEALPARPDATLGDLPLLTASELPQAILQSPNPHAACAREETLVSAFAAQAARSPEAVAVKDEAILLSYRELEARANRLAQVLQQTGVGPDQRVGLFLERSPDLIVGMLAILKAGGAYVPLDPAAPRERLAFMIEDAGLVALVTQAGLQRALPPRSEARVICLDEPETARRIAAAPAEPPPIDLTGEHLAYVMYTSGSTGQPKGVLVTHLNVLRLFQSTSHWFHFGPADVWTQFHSCAFDFSVWEIWGALLYGGRLVIVTHRVSRSPEAFYELLHREAVTVLNQTPSAFRQLLRIEETPGAARPLALRHVIFGGEALEMATLRPWFERHGDRQPQLVNMYGTTETTVHVTYRPLTQEDLDASSVIGAPIPDLQVYLLDPAGQPAPLGVPGELWVAGPGLARGYLNRPELTAERFVPNPFRPATRCYRTGDLARLRPDGELEYLGRLDHQVKIRGFRIELGEIESVLCQHPAVREAVVLAHGAGDHRQLLAYVVAASPAPGLKELRTHLAARLPDYMVPANFVLLDRLPLTGNGKVDRRALPLPEPARPDLLEPYVAPQAPTEQALARIWRQVLRVERVGVNDNFFELGGNSLLVVQLHDQVRSAFRNPLEIAELFQYPTIATLAARLNRQPGTPGSSRSRLRAQRQAAALAGRATGTPPPQT